MYFIGIDLGTSSVKLLLLSENGIENTVTETYSVQFPHEGFSEQNPEDWKTAVILGLKKLTQSADKTKIRGISFGGQMHGMVILDESDSVIRPAILWNDTRTAKQTEQLNALGRDFLAKNTGNIAFAGFTAPKVLWLKENEKESFDKISKLMLPKDYLSYCFTGEFVTDVSDASGTLYFDVEKRRWSDEMLKICNIKPEWLPKVLESNAVAGVLKDSLCEELGFAKGVKVIIGAGDNAAAAVGMGTVNDGDCNISLGTSGTVFVACDHYKALKNNSIHSFAHANGKYHIMACILTAASGSGWFLDKILKTTDFAAEEAAIKTLGENSVFFLPYLMGERSPHNDPLVRGAFVGLTLSTTRSDMFAAVLEGVAFALKDNLTIIAESGVNIKKATVCGGGAKNKTWLRILSNVLNLPLEKQKTEQGPSLGAAILAAEGLGETDFLKGLKKGETDFVITPETDLVNKYALRYAEFKNLYPALKPLYR